MLGSQICSLSRGAPAIKAKPFSPSIALSLEAVELLDSILRATRLDLQASRSLSTLAA